MKRIRTPHERGLRLSILGGGFFMVELMVVLANKNKGF